MPGFTSGGGRDSNTVFGHIDRVADTVSDKFKEFRVIADNYGAQLSASLNKIASVKVKPVDAVPEFSVPPVPNIKLAHSNAPTFRGSRFSAGSVPKMNSIADLLSGLDMRIDDDMPDMPASPVVNIGAAPVLGNINKPARPDVDTNIAFPDAPDIVLPEMDGLSKINIPAFEFPILPDFNGVPPSADSISAPNVFMDWKEPKYKPVVLDELSEKVREMLSGETGIPRNIELALFNRARERISAENEREQQEIVRIWATRGFSMPQGALDKQLAVTREKGRLQTAELNRDIAIQVQNVQLEQLRFAVQQGIALEGLTANLFENMVSRSFEAVKFTAEAQISVFNAKVALFNAQNDAFQTVASVYRTKLDGALAKLTAYKTALDGQAVIGELNKQKVDIFRARLDALNMNIERYKSLMQAASVRSDIIAKQFDMYRADVQAYSESINAEKLKFDAYQAAIDGEKAKVEIFRAQTNAYAETIQAVSNKADLFIKQKSLKMEAAKLKISEYLANIDGYKAKLSADLGALQHETAAFQAEVDAWKARAGAATAEAEMQSKYSDMVTRTNIAYSEMKLKEFDAKMQNSINEAQIALEAAKAQGQFTAQLAAGALSAQNISASISGSGSASASDNSSRSESHSYSY